MLRDTEFKPDDDAVRILAAVVESSDDAIIALDLSGTIVTWNGGAERLYGYTAAEAIGQSISLIVPPSHLDEMTSILRRINEGQRVTHYESMRRTKVGTLVDVSLTASLIRDRHGRIVGASEIARDITERKRVERVQHSNEQRWRAVIASAVDGIVVIDSAGLIEAFNPAAERLFGYTESEVIGRNVCFLMPAPYQEEHDPYLANYLATGFANIIGIGREVTGLRRDGSTFPLHLAVGEMTMGTERKFTGILHDLSERVRLEERLRASEARWRSIVDSAVDGIVVIDARGMIEAFNPAAERLFGYSEADVIGRNVNMLMPAPYREEHDGYLARYLETGVPRIIGIGREVTARRRDGTTFPVQLSVGEVASDGTARKFTGILHDLSARARVEERLREQAAMARLGEMAAVIAHEVKNPLAGIRGAIQVVGGRLATTSKDAPIVGEIIKRIDALSDLITDLLLFARPPHPRLAPVDVTTLLSATASLMSQDPALTGMRIEIAGSAPPIDADAELLKIVFLNVMVNGVHAMGGRGTMSISVTPDAGSCTITLRDTGPGIPPEVREKIFSPFFTTKARGTGLGLPTAKRLVEAHQGTISIECPPGGGTTVTVQLPAPPA